MYVATLQAPIHSGFGPQTTPRQVLEGCDLRGSNAVVTGGYSDVGLEISRALAGAGATVIVPAHTAEKARSATSGIAEIELDQMELMDPASIDAFAEKFL